MSFKTRTNFKSNFYIKFGTNLNNSGWSKLKLLKICSKVVFSPSMGFSNLLQMVQFHWSNLLLWSTFSYLMSLLTCYLDHVLNCQNIQEQNCWCQIKNSEHSTKWLFNFISYSLQHTTLLLLAALSGDAHAIFPLLIQCSLQLFFISCFVHLIFYFRKLKQKCSFTSFNKT